MIGEDIFRKLAEPLRLDDQQVVTPHHPPEKLIAAGIENPARSWAG
jgi:hypothetical protein